MSQNAPNRTDIKTNTKVSFRSPVASTTAMIDAFIRLLGECVSWLSALMVLTTTSIVLLRDGLNIGSLMLQDSITYLHATLIMLGTAYTLQKNEHVRVDILYRRFQPRQQAWIDALGHLVFLIPFCVFLIAISWFFVRQSWSIQEASSDAGGIAAVYLLKTLLLLMPCTLLLQATALLFKNAHTLVTEYKVTP